MHFLVWDVQRRDIWQMLLHILLLQRIVADVSPEQTGKKTAVDEDLLQSDIYSVRHFFLSNKLFLLCIVSTCFYCTLKVIKIVQWCTF